MIIHASVYFSKENAARVKQLMLDQSSCARAAYQAIHKYRLKSRKDVYAHLKKDYASKLKAIQIYDAIDRVSGIKYDRVIFGGKKVWNKFIDGKITKEKWLELRNNEYYASGDIRHKGNRSVRIIGDTILVSDPTQSNKWIEGNIFIPHKCRCVELTCYNTRLRLRDGKFTLTISQDTKLPESIQTVPGTIGIDSNPNGLGVSEVNGSGNLLFHSFMRSDRIQFASNNKRVHDTRILAKAVVDLALRKNKPICLEKLAFKNKKSYNRKFNRMRHNFIHRKIVESIKARAIKCGVPVKEVEPAFTSILGNLKYSKMYSLNRHDAAALVISRRGMGIKERQTFKASQVVKSTRGTDRSRKGGGEKINLEGRSFSHTLSSKAWSWFQDKFLKPKPATLTGSDPAPSSKLGIGSSTGEIPVGESRNITSSPGVTTLVSLQEVEVPPKKPFFMRIFNLGIHSRF